MRTRRFIVAVALISCLICGFLPLPYPVRAADVSKRDYMVVLGTDALKTSVGLKAFMDYKSADFNVSVISMPDVAKQFPGVTDPVERLRLYLDSKVQPVPPYVLLVGTLPEIPMSRFFTYTDRSEYDVMTDACLLYDKPLSFFDSNGNGKPGELTEYITSGLLQKFVIGRLPTNSVATLDDYFPILVKAEKRYESNPVLSGMVACAVENFVEFRYNADKEGEKVKAAFSSVNWTTLYEKEGNYISSLTSDPLTLASFVANWNKGLDIVLTSAHGGNWRRIFNDSDKDGVYDEGETQWVNFWGKLADLHNTVFFGYINGCDTFIDSTWNTASYPYIDDLLAGKLLNFVGYASQTVVSRDIPLLSDFFASIANGYSIGDALLLAKAKTSKNDILWPWWSVVVSGDPSARVNNALSSMKSVSSGEVFQPGESIDLSWDGVNPTWDYNVQVGTSSDFTNLVKSEIVEAMSYTISSLIPGSYYWRVRGMYDNGAGSWSAIVKFTITDPITLLVGSLLSETETNSITVSGSTNGDSVLVNGKKATISNEKFSIVIPLSEGNNNIVVAANKGEQTIQKSFIVIYRKPVQIEKTVIVLQIGKSMFTVNGVSQSLDSPPVIKNGRTLVPIRAIIESLGGTVSWDGVARKATVALGDTSLELWIGKSVARVNGMNTPIDSTNAKVVPEIINGRTMLPLRFVSENLGATVTWEQSTQTITITYQP